MKKLFIIALIAMMAPGFCFSQQYSSKQLSSKLHNKKDIIKYQERNFENQSNPLFFNIKKKPSEKVLKPSDEVKQKLDSVYYYVWNETANQYETESIDVHEYDSEGKITSTVTFKYVEEGSPFLFDYKEEYEYDNYGNHTVQTS
ncbi:MAG TPA: hypothetical protein VIN10_01985, partial [Bacteroidales bacterium]